MQLKCDCHLEFRQVIVIAVLAVVEWLKPSLSAPGS